MTMHDFVNHSGWKRTSGGYELFELCRIEVIDEGNGDFKPVIHGGTLPTYGDSCKSLLSAKESAFALWTNHLKNVDESMPDARSDY